MIGKSIIARKGSRLLRKARWEEGRTAQYSKREENEEREGYHPRGKEEKEDRHWKGNTLKYSIEPPDSLAAFYLAGKVFVRFDSCSERHRKEFRPEYFIKVPKWRLVFQAELREFELFSTSGCLELIDVLFDRIRAVREALPNVSEDSLGESENSNFGLNLSGLKTLEKGLQRVYYKTSAISQVSYLLEVESEPNVFPRRRTMF